MNEIVKKVILLVDDTSRDLSDMSELLQTAGYTVIDAHNPAEAITKLGTHAEIDMLLTDVQMGGNDDAGFELVQSAREMRPDLPVLMSSKGAIGNMKVMYEKKLSRLGGGEVLAKSKPFREYQSAITSLLSTKKGVAL